MLGIKTDIDKIILCQKVIALYVKGPKQCSLLGESFLPNGQETWVILFSCILYFSPWLPRSLFSSILIKEQENTKRAGFYGLGLEVGHNVFTYID